MSTNLPLLAPPIFSHSGIPGFSHLSLFSEACKILKWAEYYLEIVKNPLCFRPGGIFSNQGGTMQCCGHDLSTDWNWKKYVLNMWQIPTVPNVSPGLFIIKPVWVDKEGQITLMIFQILGSTLTLNIVL